MPQNHSHVHPAPPVQNGLEEQRSSPRPTPARCSPEEVVSLQEYLRGQDYRPEDRGRELEAAATLLSLKEVPGLTLAHIRAVILFVRDSWLRPEDDDIRASDLIKYVSPGVPRILYLLREKQAMERRAAQPQNPPGV